MTDKIPLLNYEWRDPLDGKLIRFNPLMIESQSDEYYNALDDLHELLQNNYDIEQNGSLVTDLVRVKDDIMYRKYSICNEHVEVVKVYLPLYRIIGMGRYPNDPVRDPMILYGESDIYMDYDIIDEVGKRLIPLLCEYERDQQAVGKELLIDHWNDEWDKADYYDGYEFLLPYIKYDDGKWQFKELKGNQQ